MDGFTPAGLQPGSPAGSFPLSGFDNINPYNGNLNLSLPLLHVGGRGSASYTIQQLFSMKWTVTYSRIDNGMGGVYEFFEPTGGSGLSAFPGYGPGALVGRVVNSGEQMCTNGYNDPVFFPTQSLTRLTFAGPDGTEYELRDQLTQGAPATVPNCPGTSANRGKIFTSSDGQSATFISDYDIYDSITPGSPEGFAADGYFKLKDGTVYRIDGGNVTWMRDRNGNKLSFTYGSFGVTSITDSLNRQITIEYNVTDPTYGLCNRINYSGFGTTPKTIWVTMSNFSTALRPGSGYSVQSPHSLFPEFLNASNQSYDFPVITGVVMPNGRSYKFYYNSYFEIARVELPTGGALEYDWGAGLTGGPASGATCYSCHPSEIYRRVLERRVYSGGGTGAGYDSRMTFSRPESYSGGNLGYVTVNQYNASGSLLTSENHYYYGGAFASMLPASIPTNYSPWEEGKEYQIDYLASDGVTVLRRVNNSWNQRFHLSWWTGDAYSEPSGDPAITTTTTTLVDTNQVAQATYSYDQFNNQTDAYEYDYGAGAAGTLIRRTHTDYLTTSAYTSQTGAHLRNLPVQQSVYDTGGIERARATYEYDNYAYDTYHAPLIDRPGVSGLDSAFSTSYGTRGNATSVSRWLLSSGTSINTYAQYDIAGNAVKTIDGRGLVTQVDYSSTYQYAYPTSMTTPIPDPAGTYGTNTALTGSIAYDFSTGLATSSTDANGKITTYQYNDALSRPTAILRPDGGRTTYTYVDVHQCGPYVETKTLLDTSARETDDYVFFDGLGRSVRTFKNDGQNPGTPYLTADTQYDALGRVWRVSNPYRSSGCTAAINPSGIWTTTAYDALGRVNTVTTPDSAQVVNIYSGNQVTVQDALGKKRQSATDALGRLRQVIEDPGSGHLNYQTTYIYDALNNLSTVTQGGQHRYFMYDSLSRLIRARIPEQDVNASLALSDPVSGNSQWSMAYDYDSDGNLSTRTDARGVTTTYTYDNLNRNITVGYPGGAHIDHVYDGATNGRGKLYYSAYYPTTGANSVNVIDSYDPVGRPLYQRQHFWVNGSWGTAFVTQRGYDLAGNVTSQIYPSGRTVNYAYDIAKRTTSFTGNLGDGVSRTYATAISYDEWSGLSREQFGTDTPLYHKERRNVRGQTYDMRLSTVNDTENWNRGAIVNYYSFQPVSFGGSGPDNNGNLLMQQHYVPNDDAISSSSFMQQNYGYDALNRLDWVGEYQNGTNYTGAQGQNIDQYGNRTPGGYFGTGINGQQFAVDTNTNRLGVPSGQSGVMQYDANGNLTNDTYSGVGSRTYDAENRIVSATNYSSQQSVYTYDADGRRVRRNSYGQETWQAYGIDGELLAEYAANAAPTQPQKEYGYRNGELLVAAAGAPSAGSNLALGKTATQSSMVAGAVPSRAVDGNTSGNWFDNSVTHTDYQTQSWWQVDLGSVQPIGTINVWNRTDCCGNRLSSFYVLVSDNPFQSTDLTTTINQSGVSSYYTAGQGGTPTSLSINRTGRYVRVQLAGTEYLSLAEVQVMSSTVGNAHVQWLVTDQLGTPRMIADKTGSLAGISRHDYLPFGEEMYAGTGGRTVQQGYVADTVREQFTGYERDNETGLDYAQARYYASTQGRFTGVDPLMASAHAGNPQTWNRYAYVGNNPLGKIDPSGMGEYGVDDVADDSSPAHQTRERRKQQQRTVYIFVAFTPEEQQTQITNRRGQRTGTASGPNFQSLVNNAPKGTTVRLIQGEDATVEAFTNALQDPNAAAVIFIGHGEDDQYPATPFTADGINFGMTEDTRETFAPDEPVQVRAQKVAIFACDSQNTASLFQMSGGQSLIGMNSGRDGLTTTPALSQAGFALSRELIRGKGPDRAIAAANGAMTLRDNRGRPLRRSATDKGDVVRRIR